MLIRTSVVGFKNRVFQTLGALWVPMFDAVVPMNQNVLAVLGLESGEKLLIPGHNQVTDVGDVHYAQDGAEEAPTNAFGIMEVATAGTPGKAQDRSDFTFVAASQLAIDTGYPKTNDTDGDNSGTVGVDVCTYRCSWSKTDFNQTAITHGIITNVTPGASEPILTGYAFAASFDKTADDTLKVFVNHEFSGQA